MNKQLFLLPKSTQVLILTVLSVNLLPLLSTLSLWFLAICAIVVLWQWAIFKQLVGAPRAWMKSLIALCGCVLLIASGKSLGLLAGMIHLLCLSFILKPLELRRRADFYQFVVLSFLVTTTAFIFEQSIYFAMLVGAILLLNIMLLLSYFYRETCLQPLATYSTKLLLQSMPIAIALFVLFPKISPFWQVPQAKSSQTGLSDSLTIGDLSKLALSNELAFRVEFEGTTPSYQQLYWRAMVLEKFDGKTWQRKRARIDDVINYAQVPSNRHNISTSAEQLVRYQIIQETSFKPWLFVLDLGQPDRDNPLKDVIVLNDYSLVLKDGVNKPVAYKLASDLNARLNLYESNVDLRFNTSIDASSNPRLYEYGQTLKENFNVQSELIAQVLQTIRQQNYRYTLEPPPIPDHSLDSFFFDTKAGFCEHYASSFTYLMRAAGIPARVVLGYMGGSYNNQGQYFRVLQREAHAWVEVWFDQRGWVRVDPTAAVDPGRVSQGFSSQLLQEQTALANFSFSQWMSGQMFDQLRYYVDMLDYQWTKAVINYSSLAQFNLLTSWFGQQFKLMATLSIFVTLLVVVFLYFAVKWLQSVKTRERNPHVKYYELMLKGLAKKGIYKTNEETDAEFIRKLKEIDTNIAMHVALVIRCFNKAFYQHMKVSKQDIIKMRQAVRQINKTP